MSIAFAKPTSTVSVILLVSVVCTVHGYMSGSTG